jgi:hypothetical protein
MSTTPLPVRCYPQSQGDVTLSSTRVVAIHLYLYTARVHCALCLHALAPAGLGPVHGPRRAPQGFLPHDSRLCLRTAHIFCREAEVIAWLASQAKSRPQAQLVVLPLPPPPHTPRICQPWHNAELTLVYGSCEQQRLVLVSPPWLSVRTTNSRIRRDMTDKPLAVPSSRSFVPHALQLLKRGRQCCAGRHHRPTWQKLSLLLVVRLTCHDTQ